MRSPLIWIPLLIAMNILWGGAPSAVKLALRSLDPASLSFWRFFLSLLVIALIVIIKRPSFKMSFADGTRVFWGGIFLAGSNLSWMIGISLSHAADASLLYVLEPISAILLAGIFLKEKLRKTMFVGLFLVIIGFAILSGIDEMSETFSMKSLSFGNFLIVVGLLCDAAFSTVLKPVSRRVSALAAISCVTAVALIAISIFVASQGIQFPITPLAYFSIGYLAIICMVIGFTLWVSVMKYAPLNIMLFTIFVQPIAGPIIANVFLGEKIDKRIITSGIFLLSGTFVAILGHVRAHRKELSKSEEEVPLMGNV